MPQLPQPMPPPQTLHQPRLLLPQPTLPPQSLHQRRHCRTPTPPLPQSLCQRNRRRITAVTNQPRCRNCCTNAAVTAITAPTINIAAIIAPTLPPYSLRRHRRCNHCANATTAIAAPTLPPQLLWPTNAIAATTARTPLSPQSLRQPTPPLPQPTPTPQSLRQHHHRRNRCADAAITAIAAPTLSLQSMCQHHRCNRCTNATIAAITTLTLPLPPPR